jgi:putative flippase GtrA
VTRNRRPLPLLRRGLDSTLVRFVLVGGFGELLYLALFALALRAGAGSLWAIVLAGGTCLVVNALLHARISFRVRFHRALLIDYLLIQGLCLLLALGLGWLLERHSTPAAGVAIATLLVWAGTSFLLTRWRYRRSAGLDSRQTSHWPR